MSFATGNIVFLLRSPSLIKDYLDFGNYITSGNTVDNLKSYLNDKLKTEEQDLLQLKRRLIGVNCKKSDSQDKELKRLFWKAYNYFNESRPKSRHICGIFYLLGFILFSIVATTNILWVFVQL